MLSFKLISYVDVMRDVHHILIILNKHCPVDLEAARQYIPPDLIDDKNLELLLTHRLNMSNIVNLKSLFYFAVLPTLCFQLHYPTNNEVRKMWLIKKLAEFVFCLLLFSCIYE